MGNAKSKRRGTRVPCTLCRKEKNLTLLMVAARNGHLDCLEAHMKHSELQDYIDFHVSNTKTALIFAAENGHARCVDLLIRYGADVNYPDSGLPSLIHAVRRGRSQCVDLILRAGAAVNYHGLSINDMIFHNQMDGDSYRNVFMYIGANMGVTLTFGEVALFLAVVNGDTATAISLLSYVDVNFMSECKCSALMVAAATSSVGGYECLKLLLTVGAHVNKTNVNGKNALQICIAQSNCEKREKCLLLFAAGEYIDRDADGFTFLGERHCIPECIKETNQRFCLKHLCRETIRARLLYLDSHSHLFGRISELGQPSLLKRYLLYEISLE